MIALADPARLSADAIAVWEPTEIDLADPEFRAYRWLKAPPACFPVFVGYGTEDRFAEGMQAIAERFPPAARCALRGDHDWPVWRDLWEHFLNLGHFAT